MIQGSNDFLVQSSTQSKGVGLGQLSQDEKPGYAAHMDGTG